MNMEIMNNQHGFDTEFDTGFDKSFDTNKIGKLHTGKQEKKALIKDLYQIIEKYKSSYSLNNIDVVKLHRVIGRSLAPMTQSEFYNFIADKCISLTSFHPEYKKLASLICIDRLIMNTDESILSVAVSLYNNIDRNGNQSPLISDELYDIILNNHQVIQNELKFERDYYFDYFGLRTLERSYLYKVHYEYENNDNQTKIKQIDRIIERPQHMFMRVALGIHGKNLTNAFETYHLMSNRLMTHATPTLFNSGGRISQLSSCFLLAMNDSIEGIFETVADVAKISKWAGGIGIAISDIRAKGSLIRKTNGLSDGVIPLCQLLSVEGKYVNQGGKRNGSIVVYIEPWHADIFEICEIRKNNKDEKDKARDLFLALWVPNLFMKRVKSGGKWSLMCPDECPGLTTTYGEEFEKLYEKYEAEGRYRKQINAVELWYHIISSQIETGMPYMVYKDHANEKSNQKNLGTIKCSNLCSEIIQYTDDKNIAVCNLASICLPRFYNKDTKTFDFDKLMHVVKVLVNNLDIIIDINYYSTEKARNSNMNNRPIGIGVQGLADLYNNMAVPFDSPEAYKINIEIFEAIYFAAITKSNELAKERGYYPSFQGSPASEGILQFHMWGVKEEELKYDWKPLIESVKQYGLRNSLLTTCMPTASTAQIMGCNESIEPYLTNVFTRETIAGSFIVINENLVYDLIDHGLWNETMRKKIIVMNGSIQDIPEIPQNLKEIYKTAFEIKMKPIIKQSFERGRFIDQSQSLNLFLEKSDFDLITSAHFYGWENGLKTGLYYLRTRPAVNPIQFGIDAKEIKKIKSEQEQPKDENRMCVFRPGVKVSECSSCT